MMKPRTTSKAKTAAEQAEDRLVFDRPISLQQYNATQKAWSELEHIHANINKAISTGGANPSDSAHKNSYHFRVRYHAALDGVRDEIQHYRISYNGDSYELEDYDDYNDRHRVIKLTATKIRTGTVSLITETVAYDDIGQRIPTETKTALPCTEYEVTESERADAHQISLLLAFRLRIFRSEYNGERRAEYGGKTYRIGSVRYVNDCVDLYLGERIGDQSGTG